MPRGSGLKPYQYLPSKYPTPELKLKVTGKLLAGISDTEIAKWLMMDEDVALYMSVKLIQQCKRSLRKLAIDKQ